MVEWFESSGVSVKVRYDTPGVLGMWHPIVFPILGFEVGAV